jgi:two-component system response regulator HydG
MTKTEGKILVVDDDEDVLLAASMLLKRQYSLVKTISNPEKINQILRHEVFDVVLLDMNFSLDINSGREGFFWLRNIKTLCPGAAVVLFTAYGDVELAVKAIKEGAFDFVLKPWHNEKLQATIHAAFGWAQSQKEIGSLKDREKEFIGQLNAAPVEFIGQSAAMQSVFQTIRKVANTPANVLITGENGTGKELVARELHRQSQRAEKPFITVDMGAITESLYESELFGHVKGAFTDARDDRAGRFEIADKGSLFLDEIGNLPLLMQPKLLAVLQNRQIMRVGSNKIQAIDVRLICATNLDLKEEVRQNRFRQDLLYRMNTVEIQLPPLRDREEDIAILASHYLESYSRKYQKKLKPLSKEVLRKLLLYHWPGNVRELQHALERAVILSDSNELNWTDLIPSHNIAQEINPKALNLDEMEKTAVEKALKKHAGNISQAAQELGLSRAALYRRMEKYDL